MKRLGFVVGLIGVALTSTATAQKTTEIWFDGSENGNKTATAFGHLSGYPDSDSFIVHVAPGQTLDVIQLKSSNSKHYVTLSVFNPTGREVDDHDASCNNQKRISSKMGGSYIVTAQECQKADAWAGCYRLRFSLR